MRWKVLAAVAGAALTAWGALPESAREDVVDWVGRRTWRREDDGRAEELVGCANYLEEAANQYARAGKQEVAESIRESIRGMVSARNQAASDGGRRKGAR